MEAVISGGLLAGESEARITPGDFPVEPHFRVTVGSVGRPEFPQSRFHFLLGATGSVAGAVAGSTFLVKPVGLLPKPLSPLEKRGVALGVSLNNRGRIRSWRGVRRVSLRGVGTPNTEKTRDAGQRPTHRRTQEAQLERR